MDTVFIQSPLGLTRITGDKAGVSIISCNDVSADARAVDTLPDNQVAEPVRRAALQLADYFAGTRQSFDFRTNPVGTPFQQTVWRALLDVPFGTTLSYMTLTRQLGSEKAVRAVAAANGRNPLWIVVPCHRIIGSDGSLTGYAGGLWRKQWLLEHEGVAQTRPVRPSSPGQLSLF
jgi:methylated-DNA-[protein]-cysteine S-methyltransferase